MEINKINLGADPECFLFDIEKGEIISAINIVPGTKEKPYRPKGVKKGFAMQTDNILVEYNVPASPLEDGKTFIENLWFMRNFIENYVKEINPAFGLVSQASAFVNPDQLNHPEAMRFGCDPDFNAYTKMTNPKPRLIKPNFRSAGFHIHIGYENPSIEKSLAIVKYFDAFVSLQSVAKDPDKLRRTLYGKAGCFRFVPYGVEVRVLSGYFIKDIETITWVYERILKAVEALRNDVPIPPENEIVNIINNSDVGAAIKMINDYNLE